MNYDLKLPYTKFIDELVLKFLAKFQEFYEKEGAFTIARTKDLKELETCNRSMYSFCTVIANGICKMYRHPEFDLDTKEGQAAMFKSLEECESPVLWAFKNVEIR